MLYELENEVIKVTVRSQGAEMRSLTEKQDGTEYLWNGDPAWWKYSAPVLFPIVGKLVDGKYTVKGTTYELPGHGFGRVSEFNCVKQEKESILFALEDNEETRRAYPWKFRLEIGYRLTGRKVTVSWRVENRDEETMYFSIGAHPAFRCPIVPSENLTDCYLAFGKAENSACYDLAPGCFLTRAKTPSLTGRELSLSDEFFKDGVRVYDDLQSDSVAIHSRKSTKSLTVTAKGFPYWGLWAPEKGGSPFICIEPWFGHMDFVDAEGDFTVKDGNEKLEKGQTFQREYTIAI